jgi:hypothetical protein
METRQTSKTNGKIIGEKGMQIIKVKTGIEMEELRHERNHSPLN